MLTPATVKAAAPMPRAYKLSDSGGLVLHVAPTGCKAWRWRYRRDGREQLLTIGRWPEVSLAEARARRDAAREQLRAGIEPGSNHTKRTTLEQLVLAWHAHQVDQWSPAHARDVLASLERDVLPQLSSTPAADITPPDLLQVLRVVERRGRIETARRLRQRLSMIFAYGVAEGLIEQDPAARLSAAMRKARPPRPQPALLTIAECRDLLATCETVSAPPAVRLVSRFLALTAVRLAAVRGMRWGEIEGLGGDAPLWRVPAARMKQSLAKKSEARFDHLVPLSAAAVGVLREVEELKGYDTHSSPPPADSLVFSGSSPQAPMGENAIGALYGRAGYAGRHVPHGWRASFSTILNETMGAEWRADIDRALAHTPKDKVEAAYNRAVQLDRRRAVFERWGELLYP